MGGNVKEFDGCPRTSISDVYLNLNNAKEEHKIAFLHEVTKQIVRLLSSSNVTDTWDRMKLDNLLNVLTRQKTELGACVTQAMSKKFPGKGRVKTHFRQLKRCLIKKNYSQSSWAFIRKEVEDHQRRLLHLANSMLPDY